MLWPYMMTDCLLVEREHKERGPLYSCRLNNTAAPQLSHIVIHLRVDLETERSIHLSDQRAAFNSSESHLKDFTCWTPSELKWNYSAVWRVVDNVDC